MIYEGLLGKTHNILTHQYLTNFLNRQVLAWTALFQGVQTQNVDSDPMLSIPSLGCY